MQLVKPEEVTTSRSRLGKPDDKEKFLELALERGLVRPDGEWWLIGSGVVLNPSGFGYYGFTSQEAAENYHDLFYEGARYTVMICRKVKSFH